MPPLTVVEHTTPSLPCTPQELFDWHTRPGALERLTPPWERVEVLEQSGGIENGTQVRLRVHVGPLAVTWTARHRDVDPGRQFVDQQVSGPFPTWIHTHRMLAEGPGHSRLEERVEFSAPFGWAGTLSEGLVRRKVERMLRYRHAVLADDFAARERSASPPLHVAVTGASGLLGSALVPLLTTGGHRVTRLVRRPPRAGEVQWDPHAERLDGPALEGVDAVIHLGGESIGGGRWTAARKRRIVESRVRSTRLLARTLAQLAHRPAVLVSVSAVGIFGSRGDEVLSDGSAPGTDFLADLCGAWERAADPAADAGIRVVHPRLGVVLTPAGGMLAKLLPPFLGGVGGPLGSGRQWVSWLSVDDAIGILQYALLTPWLAGAVNAAAPGAVTNAELTRTLAEVLHRPALVRVPAAALRALFGEMADATILSSQRALPAALEQSGYVFRHPALEPALRHLLGR